MRLSLGSRLGPYEIIALIGAGGMGEVYRARDTKLGRDVALKVLPTLFAADAERLARFEREAHVLASLNHPNIGAIHGFEESNGVHALVLELIEGPTLADRIAGGPIPLDEALWIAREIAGALEAAHERGITHRDLKPSNIKLRPDGVVKVLDFGLAKAAADVASGDPSASPTMTAMGTQAGVIIGTAAYMSPEQARGHTTDKRTDVWAFGCVLCEMLTGKKTFDKDTVSDTLAAVLNSEPDWTALGSTVPAPVRLLMRRCLEKDRKRRVADISTALFIINELAIIAPAGRLTAAEGRTRGFQVWRLVAVLVAIALVSVGTGTAVWFQTRSSPRRVARLTITPSGTSALTAVGVSGRDMAIAPDGAHIVYIGNKGTQLFGRAIDQLEPVPLTGSGSPRGLFFSPDGQWIGFVEQFVSKKVAVTGGSVVTLGGFGAGGLRGATWGENGAIIFATDENSTGLEQLPETGGELKVLTRPNRERGEVDHVWPEYVPGRQAVLFTIIKPGGIDNAQVAVLDLRTGTQKSLVQGGSHARYLPSGHLVYGAAGTLRAVAFDLDRLEVTGTPVSVLPQLLTTSSGSADFDVASDGTLVYVPGGLQAPARTLVWVDRQGHEEPLRVPVRAYQYPRLSPDGTRVALDIRDQENDIWIWEFARETLTRLTVDPTLDRFPVWMPDGRHILFTSDGANAANLFRQAADGTGTPEQLTQSPTGQLVPMSVAPDGTGVVLRVGIAQGFDLSLLALSKDHRIQPLVHTPFSEQNGEISPDGGWLAYQSNDSGRFEVYVRPFPDVNSGRSQVSSNGGTQPLWARGGRELIYGSSGNRVGDCGAF